jgi:hypothetical protein
MILDSIREMRFHNFVYFFSPLIPMRTLARYIIGLSTLLPLMAVAFDQQSNLADRWTNDRPAVEAKMVLNHTGRVQGVPTFFKGSFDANVTALNRYTQMVRDSK